MISRNNLKNFLLSILAGMCIGIGGAAFLSVGSTVGAVLFSFGLACVIVFGLKLFTGMAGIFTFKDKGFVNLLIALFGNIIGCLITARAIACYSILPVQDAARAIASARMTAGVIRCYSLAIGCGFIVDLSVRAAKQGKWIVLIFGIPTFILCGFPHCVADAFYIFCLPVEYFSLFIIPILCNYIAVIIGNFIGCNIYRLFTCITSEQ